MKTASSFVQSVLGGLAVGIGGTAFLAADSRAVGAFLFTVGLFTICVFGLNLYTGKVCYCCSNKVSYLGFVGFVWVGNFVGAGGLALLLRTTRMAQSLVPAAGAVCATKLDSSLWSAFVLAVLCNIMIYIGVENYNKNPHEVGKYFGLVMVIMVFIFAGFEHSIANMFYYTLAGVWNGTAALHMLVITLGNGVGGILLPLAKLLKEKAEQ